ncbi:MAG: MMPL family transporter [Rhodothermales bacterium]|nr:MMPL family transporter [Rhodothermales bacterium]
MQPLFRRLTPLFRFIINHPVWILVGAIALTALSFSYASRLSIEGDISKLIPEDYASYKGLQRVRESVGGGSQNALDVIIESPSFEANKAFAETLIPRALQLDDSVTAEPLFVNVEFRRDTEFIRKNALYFTTFDELDRLQTYLQDRIEEEKLKANPFYFELDDEEEEDSTSTEEEFREAYDEIVKKEYPISDDSTTMLVRFYPNAVRTDLNVVERTHESLMQLIEDLHPMSFHAEMETMTGGSFIHESNQIRLITRDIRSSFGVGASSLLAVVLLYFFFKSYRARAGNHFDRRIFVEELLRVGVAALLLGIPLLMSLSWAYGLAYLTYEKLNALTSPLGLVLFGLGIDFGIHFYARYVEERGEGQSPGSAMMETFMSTGQAITVSAMTTAVALYVLTLADFRGFSEFGFLMGSGVLFAFVAMMAVLPAMIIVFERIRVLKLDATRAPDTASAGSRRRFPLSRTLLVTCAAYVLLSLVLAPQVSFNYNPGFSYQREYNKKKGRVMPSSGRQSPAMIVTDERSEIAPLIRVIQDKIRSDTLSPTIGEIESLQDRVPLDSAAQQEKLATIAEIRELLDDPFIQNEESEYLDLLRDATETREALSINDVPDYLKRSFTTKTGEVGNLIMIYPAFAVSGGRASIAFANDVQSFVTEDGKTHYPGSTSLVAAEMIQLMQRESPLMIALTFLIILVLMLVNFRSVLWALLALVPVVAGMLWMLGTMVLLGIQLDFYNLVILPAILGIGNDAGVHIVHRFRELGKGSIMDVLRSSGEHVVMASLTTMIGFGGLLISMHTGISSIGKLAVIGISATMIAAIILLPALLQWLEDRGSLPMDHSGVGMDETAVSAKA